MDSFLLKKHNTNKIRALPSRGAEKDKAHGAVGYRSSAAQLMRYNPRLAQFSFIKRGFAFTLAHAGSAGDC